MSVTRSTLKLLQLVRATNQMRSLCHMTQMVRLVDDNTVTNRYCAPLITCHTRSYAKGRDKAKSAKKVKGLVEVDDDEFGEFLDIQKYRSDLDKMVESLKHDYVHNLALKTNLGSYEKLQIQTKDGAFPLNQIASIIQKSPTIIVITLTRAIKYVPDVMSTLRSTMNLNPQQEGQAAIIVTVSKVSREHREELSKKAKVMFNATKDKLNKEYTKFSKKTSKASNEELKRHAAAQLLHEKNQAEKKAEKLMNAKVKELLD